MRFRLLTSANAELCLSVTWKTSLTTICALVSKRFVVAVILVHAHDAEMQFGRVESVRVMPERRCAFVNFVDIDSAMAARVALRRVEIAGDQVCMACVVSVGGSSHSSSAHRAFVDQSQVSPRAVGRTTDACNAALAAITCSRRLTTTHDRWTRPSERKFLCVYVGLCDTRVCAGRTQ
jgi:hypothetical protein